VVAVAIAACARTTPTVDTTQTTGGTQSTQSSQPNPAGNTSGDPEMSLEPREADAAFYYTPAEQPWSSEERSMPGGVPQAADAPPRYKNPEPVGVAPPR